MHIDYLILALTNRCNLACGYCYNGEIAQPAEMNAAVLAKALELADRGSGPLLIQLTGGEPTLVPEMIFRTAELAAGLNRPWRLAVQTNATCLTPELVDFFRQKSVRVGVSLDGPPAIQQQLRGRAGDTLAGLQLMEAMGAGFRVTTVVSRVNAHLLGKLVLLLAGFRQARGIGLDLLVSKGRAGQYRGPEPAGRLQLQQGLKVMLACLAAVNKRRTWPLQLRELDLVTACLAGRRQNAFCQAARGRSLAVAPDGGLFSCSQTLGDERFSAGTVWQPEKPGVGRLKGMVLKSSSCRNCTFHGRCPGECPSRLFYNSPETGRLACTLYRALAPAAARALRNREPRGEQP